MGKKPAKFLTLGVYFLGLGLLLYLGSWQLVRGFNKQQVEVKVSTKAEKYIVVGGDSIDWGALNYRFIVLQGKWLTARSLLMDNRVYNGAVGYELLVPFVLKQGGMAVLVNLGWISNRNISTTIDKLEVNEISIQGQLYLPEKGFTLGAAFTDNSSWPRLIQYFDQNMISKTMGISLAPGILVLDRNQDVSLPRIWQPYVMSASRHFGYAFQWWGLALVMMVFGVIWQKRTNLSN